MFFNRKTDETELLEVLGNDCGIGLWDSIMVDEGVLHPRSRWMFTNEFRKTRSGSDIVFDPLGLMKSCIKICNL